ncbi:hypothetical protein [Leisingera sp. ANG59]|uniref:hypothetical protein n=1 Tax=Leisingera sp. ANG59 TaxID=2675221 RepID=UPI001572E408|nr:hypothetical protein [Leisingera sp. ANG59]NSY41626.1 hypothetical protein [Leisingera sp. ANG59]
MTGVSNRDKARIAVRALEEEIKARDARGETLPLNGSALHLGRICQLVGVGRATVQQNPQFKASLMAYAEKRGLAFSAARTSSSNGTAFGADTGSDNDLVSASRLREEQRRTQSAEKRISELLARNAALRAKVKRLEATEEAIASGGRFTPSAPRASLNNLIDDS